MIGIEQEYILLDERGQVQHQAPALLEGLGPRFPFEHHRCQVEHNSNPGSIDQVLEELAHQRGILMDKASSMDLVLYGAPWAPYQRPEMGQVQAEHFHLEAKSTKDKLRIYENLRAITPELRQWARNDATYLGDLGGNRLDGNPNVGEAPTISEADLEKGHLQGLDPVKSRHFDVTPFASTGCTVEVRFPDMHPSFQRTETLAQVLSYVAKHGPMESLEETFEAAGASGQQAAPSRPFPNAPESWTQQKQEAYQEIEGHSHLAWIARSVVKAEPKEAGKGTTLEDAEAMDSLAQTGHDFQAIRTRFLALKPHEWPEDPYALVLAHRCGLHRKLMLPVLARLQDATLHDPTSAMEALARYRIPIPTHWVERDGPAGAYVRWIQGEPWQGDLPEDPVWKLRFLDLGPTN